MLQMLGFPNGEVSLLFVSDSRMRELNRRYRRLDQTTDVLSFPLQEFQSGKKTPGFQKSPLILLGDVVISIPMALKQAQNEGRSADEEILTLLIHGVLHLVGYDHETSLREEKRMRKKEMDFYQTFARRLPSLTQHP